MADVLDDPGLEIPYWLPEQALLGRHGRRVSTPTRRTQGPDRWSPRSRARRRCAVAALVHDVSLLEQPALLEAVTASTRRALERTRPVAESATPGRRGAGQGEARDRARPARRRPAAAHRAADEGQRARAPLRTRTSTGRRSWPPSSVPTSTPPSTRCAASRTVVARASSRRPASRRPDRARGPVAGACDASTRGIGRYRRRSRPPSTSSASRRCRTRPSTAAPACARPSTSRTTDRH